MWWWWWWCEDVVGSMRCEVVCGNSIRPDDGAVTELRLLGLGGAGGQRGNEVV